MEIRYICIADLTPKQQEEMYHIIPDSRKKELAQVKSGQKRLQSLAGEYLARRLLSEMGGEPPEHFHLCRTEQGKPYLREQVNGLPCYFNISHSGEYVMAAVGGRPLGVDIEKAGRDIRKVLRRICSGEELLLLEKEISPTYQMELWTRKEALVKCLGTGITDPRMKTAVGRDCVRLWLPEGEFLLQNVQGPAGYCCAVCEKLS